MNYDKTKASFSKGVNQQLSKEIVDILGVMEVDRHEKYLVVPTIVGQSKNAIFVCLKDKLWRKKISGWKEKLLLKLGK